ncbi:PheS-related mystery ligase SrmL [Arthrobacter sp. CG_A4]|uniref:PheS-related mystery ligase SrmL n=1 Tax=Arthrobacter sp. CG_A4 TaxID=3071706 RepID=UPI002E069DA4|nr:phenylalanyl-tRNA synthetase alpha chain [Arthrobacter sp. CG_A4]
MPTYLSPSELHDALTIRDLSNPDDQPHAMQALLQGVIDTLCNQWGVPARIVRHSPLVSVIDNYDRLGFNESDVTRDQRYSRYVSPTVMLRSHTSASIPSLLRALDADDSMDELWAIPGLVYRRDSIDRTHVGTPHQVDLWRVSSRDQLDSGNLQEMIASLVQAVLPGAQWRAVPALHPYTRDGLQVDVLMDGEWLELAECGLMAPHLFSDAGLDSAKWSGLALGMGLDRALMLRKGIPDIRLLRSTDQRIEQQLLDLSRWKPVSQLPSIRRDISIVVPADMDAEVLGDRVRTALGRRAEDLECVELLALTSYGGLPPAAQERLRICAGQANALIRLVLRPLARTMTDPQANRIRDDVYLALHEGPVKELIAG